jgi:hypothetical protein
MTNALKGQTMTTNEQTASPVIAAQDANALPTGPVLHIPSGFVFDEVLAAVKPDDLVPLTLQTKSCSDERPCLPCYLDKGPCEA